MKTLKNILAAAAFVGACAVIATPLAFALHYALTGLAAILY